VTFIKNKMRWAGLRWFGHIKKRNKDVPVRRCKKIDHSDYKRSRDRSKKSWSEVISYDLKSLGLVKDMTHYRRL